MCLMTPTPLPERRLPSPDWIDAAWPGCAPSLRVLLAQESAVAGCAGGRSLGHSLASPAASFRAQVLALTRGGVPRG